MKRLHLLLATALLLPVVGACTLICPLEDLLDIAGDDQAADTAGSAWGVNAHLPDDRTLDLIKEGGFGWARVSLNWHQMEETEGTTNYEVTDERIEAVRAHGLSMLAMIGYTPPWASASGEPNAVPQDPNDWADFVYRTVLRYKDSIKHWGLWNEPNGGNGEYWAGTPAEFREKIVKPGAAAVKRADPNAFVCCAGVTIHTDWMDWMEGIFGSGGADCIDIITVHIYVEGDAGDLFFFLDDRAPPYDGTEPLETLLTRLGLADKPVWIQETGWRCEGEKGVGEARQADYLHGVFWGVSQRDWIDKVFVYEIIDDPTVEDTFTYGLVDQDYAPKPSYETLKDFIANPTEPPPQAGL